MSTVLHWLLHVCDILSNVACSTGWLLYPCKFSQLHPAVLDEHWHTDYAWCLSATQVSY